MDADSKGHTRCDSKVRGIIAVKVLHNSLLNTTVVTFKVFPLRSYSQMPAPSPPFKTISELVLWNGLQNCRCINLNVINVIKCLHFNISFIFGKRNNSLGARHGEYAGCSSTGFFSTKNSLTDSAV